MKGSSTRPATGELARTMPGGRFTAARFRDASGIGRALAVQVRESLDRQGITRRIGDERLLREAYPSHTPSLHGETST